MITLIVAEMEGKEEIESTLTELQIPDDEESKRTRGFIYTIVMIALCSITLVVYMSVLIFKVKNNMAFRRYINIYWYLSILLLLIIRIGAVSWLLITDDLFNELETAAVSMFLLMNAVTLIIWIRRCILFRFEEASEYYSKVRFYSHLITVLVIGVLLVVQTIGIIFNVFNYVHLCLEGLAVILNLFITYKIVKYFKIFGLREVKKTIRWIYVISVVFNLSLLTRLYFNAMTFRGNKYFPIKNVDLNSNDKLTHFGILSAIELIPWIVIIAYLAFTHGEIERTLSVKSSALYDHIREDIGNTMTYSASSRTWTSY